MIGYLPTLQVRTKDIEVKGRETELGRREKDLSSREAAAVERKAAELAAAGLAAVRDGKLQEREARVAEREKGAAVSGGGLGKREVVWRARVSEMEEGRLLRCQPTGSPDDGFPAALFSVTYTSQAQPSLKQMF